MNPKSKKDQHTVECDNEEQTRDVLCYIYNDNDREWRHWKYVTRARNNKGEIEQKNILQYPVISFEEWKSIPDEEFTLPEEWALYFPESEYNIIKKFLGWGTMKTKTGFLIII